jgi:hypothetical protein
MSSSLMLGSFEFLDTEIPAELRLGGDQTLAIHRFIGGGKSVQPMGCDDKAPAWTGIFRGSEASTRAQYIDGLRIAGNSLLLTWDAFSYNVVIKNFEFSIQQINHIPFSITLEVVKNNTSPVTNDPGYSIDDLLNDDMNTVTTLSDSINDPSITSSVSALQSVMNGISSFAKAANSVIQSIVQPIEAAQKAVEQVQAQVQNTLMNITTLGGVIPNNPISTTVASEITQTNSMIQAPQLMLMNAALGRMKSNVSIQSSGVKQITVAGTNLYRVAAQQYGDPSAWTTIANANGLTDPMITGVVTLNIPALSDGSGGILNG